MIRSFLSICIISLSSGLFAQQKQTSKAELQFVTLYNQAAALNHSAKATLAVGSSELILSNIANEIDLNSIQIATGADVTVLSVRTAQNYLSTDSKTQAYLDVEKDYKKAKNNLDKVVNLLETEESTLALLEKNQQITGANATTTVQALSQMTDFYKAKYLETKNNISTLKEQVADQQELLAKINIQFEEIKGQNTASNAQLVLQVQVAKAGLQEFNISYITRAASWTPTYEIRVANIHSPLQLNYKAHVYQHTGIDWKAVRLKLSTGNPTQGGVAPTLSPWLLRYYEPAIMANNAVNYDLAEVAMVQPAVRKSLKVNSPNAYTEQQENQLNTTFDIAIPYDIASNGQAHAVGLQDYSLAARYHYFAAPVLDQEAYLVAELSDYEKLNLIPGQANVIFENMFVGKTQINPNGLSDTLKLSLGRDKMIHIKREKLEDLSQTKTIGSSKTQTLLYEIKIKNNKNTAIQLNLQDRYPISTDKSMQVEVLETSGAQVNTEKGLVDWDLQIPAGATKTLKFSYSVKYPKDKVILLN